MNYKILTDKIFKTNKYNDINLDDWKKYLINIKTDALWVEGKKKNYRKFVIPKRNFFQKNLKIFITIVFLSLTSLVLYSQKGIPEIPKYQTSLYDYANLLNESEHKFLEQKLIKYNDTTSTQIVVVTLTSIGINDISMFGTELAHKWKIGQKDKDNGILVLVAKNERKINISTGYGIEHLLTDALSRRIIEQKIKPSFRAGNFYKGLDEGTTAIIKVMNGEYKADAPKKHKEDKLSKIKGFFIVLILILILVFINKNRGGGKGRRNISSGILTAILLSSVGRSSGSFGGSGGFGNSGFGGGSFGGGGASGSW